MKKCSTAAKLPKGGVMQIHNFYTDLVPSVRNPLDSIVLSPHDIRPNDASLTNIGEDACDYQTLLPSISRCEYHDQCIRLPTNSFSMWIRNRLHKLNNKCDMSGDKKI
jgi:hypothetical protein